MQKMHTQLLFVANFASTTEKTINVTTASGVGSRDVKVRIKNPTGTWSDVFDSSSQEQQIICIK